MTTLNPDYAHLRAALEALPHSFERSGDVLHRGRNEVRLVSIEGLPLVVKRFRRLGFVRSFVYRYLRTSKAQRAFDNAVRLRRLGFCTPEPVGWLRAGAVYYYVCRFTDGLPVKQELIERDPYNAALVGPYARFVASLHDAGVLHCDLNPTNVLFTALPEGGYRFELIDINRMRFYADGPVPVAECMENLTLFWWLTDVYRAVLGAYAEARGWQQADVERALRVKQRHDRRWVRRKRFTGWLKRCFRRTAKNSPT